MRISDWSSDVCSSDLYSFWYDTLNGSGVYFYDNGGDLIDPSQHPFFRDHYTNNSHELRLVPPSDDRLRLVAGAFRSAERRVGKEGVSKFRSRWWPGALKHKQNYITSSNK